MDKQGHPPPPPGFAPPPPYSDGHGMPHPHHPPPLGVPIGPSVVVMHAAQFGPDPQSLACPYCNATITTNIETSPSTKTHIMALLLCLFGCWPCAPCVYCADSCLLKKHYCPNCQKFLGAYDS